MAAPEAEIQKRMADWFASLDPIVQGVLEGIYAEGHNPVTTALTATTEPGGRGE